MSNLDIEELLIPVVQSHLISVFGINGMISKYFLEVMSHYKIIGVPP